MVSFDFSPEQQDFRRILLDYARTSLAPAYIARAAKPELPVDAMADLGRLGVLGIGLPESAGGTGVEDPVMLGLATEALAYGDVNVAAAPVQVGLTGAQLAMASDEVRERYLPPLVEGTETVAIALTEPGSGSDAAAMRTTARPVEDGWRLTGEKTAITWAMNATTAVVYAREPGSTGPKGVSAYVVPLDSEGVTRSPLPAMGCAPLGWGALHFDEVHVPATHRIGGHGEGFRAVMGHFDFSRAALGLMCLGAAQASLDEALLYSQEREAFGSKLSDYQGISFLIAEQMTYLEAARWVCYRTLWMRQEGQPHTAQASMSKWWAPVVAKNAIEAAMRVHGNLGYSADFPLQQRHRDVMAYLVADGTAEIQKRVIAREAYRRGRTSW